MDRTNLLPNDPTKSRFASAFNSFSERSLESSEAFENWAIAKNRYLLSYLQNTLSEVFLRRGGVGAAWSGRGGPRL
jgi:hypothetical protein